MSGMWGNNLKISIFGESHGNSIGITIDGLKPGIELDIEKISMEMKRRSPGRSSLSTSRKENDVPEIVSGYFNGKTTGTPLCAIIKNVDTRSKDYTKTKDLMRPSHADYTGYVKYLGFNDYRGGGHFSGRITAPLVFCGAICKQILEKRGIEIGCHIKKIKNIEDSSFDFTNVCKDMLIKLRNNELPVIDTQKEEDMRRVILESKQQGDSVGGVVECCVVGIDAGIGDPFFNSVESVISHLLFSVPAVKGVEFGLGFEMANMYGSQCNDEFYYDGDTVKTKTNNNGGILGGITSGMPIIFRAAIKPTASILKEQDTINISDKTNEIMKIEGRHDPCIVQRVIPVIEAVTAIGILDLLKEKEKWSI